MVDKSIDTRKPTCGLLVNVGEVNIENLDNKVIRKITLHERKEADIVSMPCYKDHEFQTIPKNMFCTFHQGGNVDLVTETRRGFKPFLTKIKMFDITIAEARQAKCTQPWFDPIKDPNDRFEIITFVKINIIKKMHAVMNNFKLLTCIKCGKTTPGLDMKFEDITVWEQHEKKRINEDQIVKCLTNSKVLSEGVQLDSQFKNATDCVST